MRIGIISPNRKAYSETFIKAHIDRLDEVVLVLTDGFMPKRKENGSLLLDLSFLNRVARKIRGKDIEHLLAEKVKEELQKASVDVVLAEYGPTGVQMLPICRKARIPLVVHFHGIDAYHNDILKKHGSEYKTMFEQCSSIIAVSEDMERQLLDISADKGNIILNSYGVDTDQFKGGQPDVAEPRFIGIGRFTEKKAPYLTILAFAKAVKEMPNAHLTLIGDGPLLDPCLKIITALQLDEQIDLPGVLPPEEIAIRLKKSRAFVQHSLVPSNNDHEGTPLAVIEACSTGLPVISTKHAGIPDVVDHGVSGLLCNENDIDKMAEHMILLARDPELAGKMGHEARLKVLNRYDLKNSISTLQSILAEAMRTFQ